MHVKVIRTPDEYNLFNVTLCLSSMTKVEVTDIHLEQLDELINSLELNGDPSWFCALPVPNEPDLCDLVVTSYFVYDLINNTINSTFRIPLKKLAKLQKQLQNEVNKLDG